MPCQTAAPALRATEARDVVVSRLRPERGSLDVKRRSRRALATTKTLEQAIAPAASIGDNAVPVSGWRAPAAMGISTML